MQKVFYYKMEYFTNIPETDALILDQMSDDDLVNYCQTHQEVGQLCNIPRIKKRIDLYHRYKTFDISTIFDSIENYAPYPILIHRYLAYDDGQLLILDDDIHIFKTNSYTNIKYYATQSDLDTYINISINNTHQNQLLNNIINSYDDNRGTIWSLDLRTTYNVYISLGLQKYAKEEILKQLDMQYNLKNQYQNTNIKSFYFLFALHLWFKTQVILYGLLDDAIHNLDIDIDDEYVQSEEYQQFKLQINQDIDDMFQLLQQFVFNLPS